MILRGIWHYQTYSQIAQGGYSPGYFTNVVAPIMSTALRTLSGVTKKKLSSAARVYVAAQVAPDSAAKAISCELFPCCQSGYVLFP